MTASRDNPVAASARGLAQFAQAIVSPTFPLVLISLCAVSYLLASSLHSPELGLWGLIGLWALSYAHAHAWARAALVMLTLAALPLAWLAARGRGAAPARTVAEWLVAAAVLGFAVWLQSAWPFHGSDMQVFAYSFLLFIGWSAAIEAAVDTLALLVRGAASA